MNRLLVFALVASIGNTSVAFAGESILKSGARHVQQIAVAESMNSSAPAATLPSGAAVTVSGKKVAPSLQEQSGNLTRSGMRKRTKAMILIGIAVGVAASMYAIDHSVVDVTPSSLGTREDF